MSGRVLLPCGRYARTPYRVQIIGRNVYCMEELCYTIAQCAAFLDERIREEELLKWLDAECGLPDLARQLRPLLKRKGGLADFCGVILLYTGYRTSEEIQSILEEIRHSRGMEPFERQVAEARFTAGRGRLNQAQEQLDAVLNSLPGPEKELRARIWKEKGILYTDIFRFENAAVCFGNAWKLVRDPQYGRFYLTCLKLTATEEELQRQLLDSRELQALCPRVLEDLEEAGKMYELGPKGRRMKQLRRNLGEGRMRTFDHALSEQVRERKENYRQSCAGLD